MPRIIRRYSYKLRSWWFGQRDERSCQIAPDRLADQTPLGLEDTDPGGEEMPLQPQERPHRHPDVVPLRAAGADLASLHAAMPLQVPVVVLDREAHLGVVPPRPRVHRQVVGGPV